MSASIVYFRSRFSGAKMRVIRCGRSNDLARKLRRRAHHLTGGARCRAKSASQMRTDESIELRHHRHTHTERLIANIIVTSHARVLGFSVMGCDLICIRLTCVTLVTQKPPAPGTLHFAHAAQRARLIAFQTVAAAAAVNTMAAIIRRRLFAPNVKDPPKICVARYVPSICIAAFAWVAFFFARGASTTIYIFCPKYRYQN